MACIMKISGIQIVPVHAGPEGPKLTYFPISSDTFKYFSIALILESFQYDLRMISKLNLYGLT